MASTNKTSLGLNMWVGSDKPVRQDFVNDNVIIDEKIAKLNSDLKKRSDAFIAGATGWSAMQSGQDSTIYRLQLQFNGNLDLYKSVDAGVTWTRKTITTASDI